MKTIAQALQSCFPYWGLLKYLSTLNHWCLGPEVAIFSPALMTPLSSPSLRPRIHLRWICWT